jgi:hypothetical protein
MMPVGRSRPGRRADAEGNTSHINITSTAFLISFLLIMKIGLLPDA